MRLSFSILWFDDNEDYFDSLDIESLEKEILSWGFSPKIELVTTPEAFKSRSPFETYDLIIVDRKLEGYKDGADFIADIRDNAVYTEVIFYTAGNTSDLWNDIYNQELEGVFVSSRSGIVSKITRVGRQSIRKVLDLENMRGIVMAEVGELDHLLDGIVTLGIENLSEEQQKSIYKRFHSGAAKQSEGWAKDLAAFIENPETVIMLSLCDSDKRWQNFNRLWKYHNKLKGQERIGNYVVEVLRPRNFLAHGRPAPHQDGGYVFHYQGKEFHFNDATSLELRLTILKYKNAFTNILSLLTTE
jgi:hypothetical protein